MKHVALTVAPSGVATITMDHAGEAMNLVSPDWIAEMIAAVEAVASDPAVRGAIVTSAKPGFMAGADLKIFRKKFTAVGAQAFSAAPSRLFRRIETCGKPFVAAVNGLALGGGFELALACHGRIIVDDARAVVGLPEVGVGLLPGAGGTQRLPRMIGLAEALDMLLSGTPLAPAPALEAGLVDLVVSARELLGAAERWVLAQDDSVRPWDRKGYAPPQSRGMLDPGVVSQFGPRSAAASAKSFRNDPAPAAILSAVFEGIQLPMDRALAVESKHFARLLSGDVARNTIRTMFLNKGQADRLAARPRDVAKMTFGTVGVLGAGMMGAGIAYAAALAGSNVVLIDRTQEEAERGKAYSARLLGRDVGRGRRTRDQADAILARIATTTDYAALSDAAIVVEAVFEDTAIKADVTRRTEAATRAGSVFASNTSTLPISGLAAASVRPDRFIGMHFFSPVERMPLVEIIVGQRTSRETIAHALDFVGHLRKTPIVVRDSRGFYTSRVFLSFIHEGMAMLGEGVAPALIENAARFAGMPVGPLAVTDEVSLDLPLKIVRQTAAELGDRYDPPVGYDVLSRMAVDLGRGGRKAGAGFYDYPAGTEKRLWADLARQFPAATSQPEARDIGRRLLCRQAMEAARCMEEGVLSDAADGDLGAILGVGFPSYTGGTLSYIDTMGVGTFVQNCDRLADLCGERFRPSEWLRNRAAGNMPFHAEG
ncbi:MAG: enoyl-CoA hydratase/isomerase family protein [Rhizobiaceae bacterium]|nr:enoyl-CoA hydratase/isomerase family protein [Rhizobiaceae bacterium]